MSQKNSSTYIRTKICSDLAPDAFTPITPHRIDYPLDRRLLQPTCTPITSTSILRIIPASNPMCPSVATICVVGGRRRRGPQHRGVPPPCEEAISLFLLLVSLRSSMKKSRCHLFPSPPGQGSWIAGCGGGNGERSGVNTGHIDRVWRMIQFSTQRRCRREGS